MISQNPLLSQASGKLGIIVIKRYGDKTVVTAMPNMSRRKLSSKQKEANERMRLAIFTAKHITRDPVQKQRAGELLQVQLNKVFRAIVKEYMLTDGEGPVFGETVIEKQDKETLTALKTTIVKDIPDAQVMLFGGKAKDFGKPQMHWDLLVLTKDDHPPLEKWQLQEKLLAITIPLGTQVNMLMVQKDKWQEGDEYKEVRKRIDEELVLVT